MSRTVVTPKTFQINPKFNDGTEGIILPVGTTAERPVIPTEGVIRYNATTGKFEGYSKDPNNFSQADWASIGGGNILDLGDVDETGLINGGILKYDSTSGNFVAGAPVFETFLVSGQNDLDAPADGRLTFESGAGILLTTDSATNKIVIASTTQTNLSVDNFTADGSTAEFTLTRVPPSPTDLLVFVDSLYQAPSSYTIVGTAPAKLVFSENIPNNLEITATFLNIDTMQATVPDGSITPVKLSQSVYYIDTFYGDATTAIYTMSQIASSANQLLVTVNGVVQDPGADNAYSVASNQITFVNAPGFNAIIKIRFLGVTFSTTSAIAPASVGISQMDIGGAGTTGQVLALGSTGGLIWTSPSSADFIYNNQTFVNATSIEFDIASGFTLIEATPGALTVGFTDYLTTITVSGQPAISIDSSRELQMIAGTGIDITTDNNPGNKKIKFDVSLIAVPENIIPFATSTYTIGTNNMVWSKVHTDELDLGSALITETNGVLQFSESVTLVGVNPVTLKATADGLQVEKIILGTDAELVAGTGVTLVNNGGRLDLPENSITISELDVGVGTNGQYLGTTGSGLQWITGLTQIIVGTGLATSSGNSIITTTDTLVLGPGVLSDAAKGVTAHSWGNHAGLYLTNINAESITDLNDVQTGVLDVTKNDWTLVWNDTNQVFEMKDLSTPWLDGTVSGAIYYNQGRVGIGSSTPLAKLYINEQESEPSDPLIIQDGPDKPLYIPSRGPLTTQLGIHLETDLQNAPAQPTTGGHVYFKDSKPYYVSATETETPLGGSLGDLKHVELAGTILNNYALLYESSTALWKPKGITLGILSNVDAITNLAEGKILIYDAVNAQWEIGDPVTSLDELTDTSLSGLADGDILHYTSSSGEWKNIAAGTTVTRYYEEISIPKIIFNFSYAPGNIDIFINGIKLSQTDFVATDGAIITLNETTKIGDIVDIVNQGGRQVNANVMYYKQTYTTLGTETYFDLSESYSAGYVDVYKNGLKLKSSEYTAVAAAPPWRVFLAGGMTVALNDNIEVTALRTITSTDSTLAIYSKTLYTAAGGEEVIASGTNLINGHFEIFLNGVKLSGTDYSLDINAININLAFPLNSGDEIEIMAFKPRSTNLVQTFVQDTMLATGGELTMVLSATPPTLESILVMVNGIVQEGGADYSINASSINFAAPLTTNDKVVVRHFQLSSTSTQIPGSGSIVGAMMNGTVDGDFTLIPYQYQNDDTISTVSVYGSSNKNTLLVGPLTMSEQTTIAGNVTVI